MRDRAAQLIFTLLCTQLVLAGCSHNAQKEATEAAVASAQTAIDGLQSDVAKYVPDQLRAAQTEIQQAQAALAKADYGMALRCARSAIDKAKNLSTASNQKRDELLKNWNSINQVIPKTLDAVKWRLWAFLHGAKFPAGMDGAALETAREQYNNLKDAWAAAVAAYQRGELASASEQATAVREQLPKLLESLGMKSS
jgi:outer membrane murein-binding lipoprotein Lpp